MKEVEKADTPERRILELRDWVKSNYQSLLQGALVAHPYADLEGCMSEVNDRVKREAMNRFVLLPAIAKRYAESAVSPFFERFETDLQKAADAHQKKTRSEFGIVAWEAVGRQPLKKDGDRVLRHPLERRRACRPRSVGPGDRQDQQI